MDKRRDPDLADEYDFSHGKRGVYYERARRGMQFAIVSDAEDRARSQRRASGDHMGESHPIDEGDRGRRART